MKVFGLDFTSAPAAACSTAKKGKRLTLAECTLDGDRLLVENLISLNGNSETDFSLVSDWLNGSGRWQQWAEWIGGIDFPLGMPLGAIEYFGWLSQTDIQSWEAYVAGIYRNSGDLSAFQQTIESWKKQSRSNDEKRVFLTRQTDKIGSFAGSASSSPMKVHPQCNPPVGRMFFRGASLLMASSVSILPVRPNDAQRIVVEAYPRLVADKIRPGAKYKDSSGLGNVRDFILRGLLDEAHYGFTLNFQNPAERQSCVDDDSGDFLDSVLCAVQAAWSWSVEQAASKLSEGGRAHSFGIPVFKTSCMRELVRLEGWIVDPLLLKSILRKTIDSES